MKTIKCPICGIVMPNQTVWCKTCRSLFGNKVDRCHSEISIRAALWGAKRARFGMRRKRKVAK